MNMAALQQSYSQLGMLHGEAMAGVNMLGREMQRFARGLQQPPTTAASGCEGGREGVCLQLERKKGRLASRLCVCKHSGFIEICGYSIIVWHVYMNVHVCSECACKCCVLRPPPPPPPPSFSFQSSVVSWLG